MSIQVLSPHVADLIAAGEVVERPASVIKELVENAIDAGATTITVEIQNGGMSLMRVTDNGCGIPYDDCETAFLRHATTKLRHAEDLAAIHTLGFRGEALAAIAAVSKIELFSRPEQEPLGTTLTLVAGVVETKDRTGCPLGTTLVVRSLFFNTPARLKFMKRDASEAAAVLTTVQKLALSHPEVALKFIKDGKQELLTPGDGQLSSTLYAVLGRDLALGFLPVQSEGEGVTVSGFVSQPVCCRGTRSYQHFFVNGRHVKSKLLTAAVEQAYAHQRMVGKFPGCVLQLSLKANTVDVNVHPAKTEVKFLSERNVFHGVYYAVLSALTSDTSLPTLVQPEQPEPKQSCILPTTQKNTASLSLKDTAPSLLTPMAQSVPPMSPPISTETHRFSSVFAKKSTEILENVDKSVENVEKSAKTVVQSNYTPNVPPCSEKEPVSPPILPAFSTAETPWQLVGEFFQTYVIAQQGDTIYFIDKHAAHERMHFDRMRAADYTPMAQTLLSPLVFTPTPEEAAALLQQTDLLAQFGFSCEDFGGGAVVVRAVPSDLDSGEAEAALCEIAEQLLTGTDADPNRARDEILHTVACKAAIKGGQKNSREELLVVCDAVLSGRVQYCPHGRPVAITMTKADWQRQFKRS